MAGWRAFGGVDRPLALPVESDVIDSRLDQDVLSASPLYQDDIARFQGREGRSHGSSHIAIDRNSFGSDPRDGGEPDTKEDERYDDPDAPGQFIVSFDTLGHGARR